MDPGQEGGQASTGPPDGMASIAPANSVASQPKTAGAGQQPSVSLAAASTSHDQQDGSQQGSQDTNGSDGKAGGGKPARGGAGADSRMILRFKADADPVLKLAWGGAAGAAGGGVGGGGSGVRDHSHDLKGFLSGKVRVQGGQRTAARAGRAWHVLRLGASLAAGGIAASHS